MDGARTPNYTANTEETLALWHELGGLYARAGGSGRRALKLSFTVTVFAAALVLLSAPVFGTGWAGPFAAVLPVAAGLLAGGGLYSWGRGRFGRRVGVLWRVLAARGLDADRPSREGLGAYSDSQLVLLGVEYEYLAMRGGPGARKAARLFEDSFGFTPEDPFEIGPLDVAPETEAMRLLRGRWERRIAARRTGGKEPPALGPREDAAYRVFPREMTVPAELATRGAYLGISREVLLKRYGRDPRRGSAACPRRCGGASNASWGSTRCSGEGPRNAWKTATFKAVGDRLSAVGENKRLVAESASWRPKRAERRRADRSTGRRARSGRSPAARSPRGRSRRR